MIAEEFDVMLAIEPEASNVVDTACKARFLLDQMQSSRLKIVMNGANMFHAGGLGLIRGTLNEAFESLAYDIVIAQAIDLSRNGEASQEAAGKGVLDYDRYISLLRAVVTTVP